MLDHKTSPAWLALQAAAIIASILLAFAIEAWWDSRQESELQQAVLASLHRDFQQNRINLNNTLQQFEVWKKQYSRYQSSTPAELALLDEEAAGHMVTSLSPGMTYDPSSGTLDALISDGRLALIEDLGLRDGLANWLRALRDIAENDVDIRSGSLRAQIASEAHGGPFQVPFPPPPISLEHFARPTGKTLSAMRQDSRFMGSVRSHHYQIAIYVRELLVLDKILNDILTGLERVIEK